MITPRSNVRPEESRFGARHTLFVEGTLEGSIDYIVIQELMGTEIAVRPLGSSSDMRAAARALHAVHPDYCFLIDRDHHNDEFVRQCWEHFPDPDKANLLVWFRREIENYFLDLNYLSRSRYLVQPVEKLAACIIAAFQQRLYFDAANLAVISVREDLKRKSLVTFKKVTDFKTLGAAVQQLRQIPSIQGFRGRISKICRPDYLVQRFEEFLETLSDGKERLEWGRGEWAELLKGKRVFSRVIDQCFHVVNAHSKRVEGRRAELRVCQELVRLPLKEQPADFQLLHGTIKKAFSQGN